MKKLTLLLLLVVFGCSKNKTYQSREGFVDVEGGKIWYKIVGTGKKTPLILLHGGPGFTSHYFKPLAALGDDRPVIMYDQLGAGRSDHPTDTSLWHVERFVRELKKLRTDLDLTSVHLLGHSWGTMLATQYLAENPAGIKSVVLASPCITVSRWLADANMLKKQLPQAVQDTLNANEARGTVTSPSYIEATNEFYKRHVCRISYPPEVDSAFSEANMQVYGAMWGNNEFTATGNLKNFDRSDVLRSLSLPTLFTCGEFDEATPATLKWYSDQTKNSQLRVVADASHLTFNEKPEEYIKILREFLNKHD